MPPALDDLRRTPNALSRHYTAFRVSERLLFTGHSHQAWPDVGLAGQQQAWVDASRFVDGKWDAVQEKVDRVAAGYRTLLGDADGSVTLDANTHALVVRFLSALDLAARPRIVTTDGEFHSIRRQLDRLAEEGVELVKVPADPVETLAERAAQAVDDRTAAVMMSSVLFGSALIVPGLDVVAERCVAFGAEFLVDAYHALGVVPFSMDGIESAFVVGGGYKYLQLGEGNCALRVPAGCGLRPVITGWFAEFGELAQTKTPGEVRYGTGPVRFAGSTFDPTSAYRAAAVMEFFDGEGLTDVFLRQVSQHQVGLLASSFRSLDLDPAVVSLTHDVGTEARGGFLALRAPDAQGLFERLLERGVRTDYRGTTLRFGPAPYHADRQITDAMVALGEAVRDG